MTSFWQTARFRLALNRPLVMGIVNATPDSFSDGGHYRQADAAKAHCEQLLSDGADILDIGGESTRPGAQLPSVQEELDRVLPVVRHAVRLGVPVSVDTSRPVVIAAVLDAGADIVNDIRALQWPGALDVVRQVPNVGVCLMHMQAQPADMQSAPHYNEVALEVAVFLRQRLGACLETGMAPEQVVLDPGYGFGKTHAHNMALMQAQEQLLHLGRPLLVGWSRKGSLGQITGRPVGERMVASVAMALASLARGASILRVHDVAQTVDAVKVWVAAGLCPQWTTSAKE